MTAVLTLLATVTVSIAVVRLASVALEMTGLSRDSARFQALSAFTGCGFTTAESENIVGHPQRRRIAMRLMIVGAIGLASVVTTVLISALGEDSDMELWSRAAVGVGGLIAITVIISNRWFDRLMCRLFARILKRVTSLDVTDYASMLRLAGGWGVTEVLVSKDGPLSGRSLRELNLRDSDVTILGLQRPNQDFVGVPGLDTVLSSGDRLFVYGRTEAIAQMCEGGLLESPDG